MPRRKCLKAKISLEIALKIEEKDGVEQRLCIFCGENVTDRSDCSDRYNIITAFKKNNREPYVFGVCDNCTESFEFDDTESYTIKFEDDKSSFIPDSFERGNS
jgi:hypothetical protein